MNKIVFCITFFPFFVSSTLFGAETKVKKKAPEVSEEELIAAAENLGPNAKNFLAERQFGPDNGDFVDPKVLRDFIESRGLIECRQKEGLLTIAADVRARWIATGEKLNGRRQRGEGTNTPINFFKSEINLFLDYVAPKGWVSTKLKWVNIDGMDGGTTTLTVMDRAFIGYDIYECGCEDFYIEIGRTKLDNLFESRVEFSSFFDGIHLFYTNAFDGVGTFTFHGGPFIVDSYTNHYAWVYEAGIKDWADTKLSFRYSLIDWVRFSPTYNYGGLVDSGTFTIRNNPRYMFLVSQMLFSHEAPIDFPGCKTLYLYGAVLSNHAAKKSVTSGHKFRNHAWYVGFTLGKLCKACDWSLDVNYQWVEMQAVPEFDLSGIGHGNAINNFFSDAIFLGFFPGSVRGFTNYKGFQISLLYALTDSLSLRTKAEWSTPISKRVGGDFFYKNFEMSVIYAF